MPTEIPDFQDEKPKRETVRKNLISLEGLLREQGGRGLERAWEDRSALNPEDYGRETNQKFDIEKALLKLRESGKMEQRQLDIIRQYYWEGKNLEEIGEINGISRDRARQLKQKALNRLEDLLDSYRDSY